MSIYFPESNSSGETVKVQFRFKKCTRVDTSKFAKKVDLANLNLIYMN